MEQTGDMPLEYLEQRLRQGEVLHIGTTSLWYAQGLFYLRLGEGNLCASQSFGRAIWTLLNTLGQFKPISEKELQSGLYTVHAPDWLSPNSSAKD